MATRTTFALPTVETLWRLTAPPAIWLVHLAGSYGVVAMACGRWASPAGPYAPAAVLAVTAAALVGLSACLAAGVRRRRGAGPAPRLGDDTPASRAQFLETTNLLLVLLSALGVGFVAFGAVVVGVCR